MKSHTEYLTFNVPSRVGFVNITDQVRAAVQKSRVREGLVLCNSMHISSSVFINDEEDGLKEDYKKWLEHGDKEPHPLTPRDRLIQVQQRPGCGGACC